jgi:dTDP-4-dehydrorhamnose reductase
MAAMALPRVLVTGAHGFLGPFVTAALRGRAMVVTLARRSGDLQVDLLDRGGLQAALQQARADFLLHLAAMSRIALCERDPAGAHAVNAEVPGELAAVFGTRMLLVSTDLVFDGSAGRYAATDPVGPLSIYGISKAAGEQRVLAHGGRIARLPLLFGPDAHGRGASAMIREGLAAGGPVRLYTNEYRSPLHCADAARGLVETLFAAPTRIVHLPGPERLSRWQFGLRFCDQHGLPRAQLLAVECQEAARPRDVSLVGAWDPGRSLAAMLADA